MTRWWSDTGSGPRRVWRNRWPRLCSTRAFALGALDRSEEALAVYEEVVERYGERPEAGLAEQVARALVLKGITLKNMDRIDDCLVLLRSIPEIYKYVNLKQDSFWMAFFSIIPELLIDTIKGGETTDDDRKVIEFCLEKTKGSDPDNLAVHLADVLQHINDEKQQEFFKKIEDATNNTDRFIEDQSQFARDGSFLLVLREWNSYTPALPAQEESDRGGGYFLRNGGEGIVIDPGYDFIDNFFRAGGRLCDIQHIIVTHAHDDHTAELEALLMLFRRFRSPKAPTRDPQPLKIPPEVRKQARLNLYISASVQRKFAGLLGLRDPMYHRVTILSPPGHGESHIVRINDQITLTVLPAYHDDVLSQDMAVGFCLDCEIGDGKKTRIVFTGDTGLYPTLVEAAGKPKDDEHKDEKGTSQDEPELDDTPGRALFERYKEILGDQSFDLLVAHIGSIKKKEFPSAQTTFAELERMVRPKHRFYVNHLGLLGTLLLMYKMAPEAVVISEFGSELKDFRIDLVQRLAEALHDRQESDSPGGAKTFVVPGDSTIAYNLAEKKFLCHESCEFEPWENLKVVAACSYKRKWDRNTRDYNVDSEDDFERVMLVKDDGAALTSEQYNRMAKNFFARYYNGELPFHRRRT